MTPRTRRVRAAASRVLDNYQTPHQALTPGELDFRIKYAFRQGADWERRQWLAKYKGAPFAHQCPDCPRGFHIGRSLAMHRRVVHPK